MLPVVMFQPPTLSRSAWRPCLRRGFAARIIHRTAGYGPVCPVVWEGRSRETAPYPDGGPSMTASLEEQVLYAVLWRRRMGEAQACRGLSGGYRCLRGG